MKRRGFTLIELVVVVAIILLLASTLAPKLRREVAKARDAKAVAALGTVRTATSVLYSDKGSVPTGFMGTDTESTYYLSQSSTSSDYLDTDVLNYLNTVEIMTMANTQKVPTGGQSDLSTLTFGGDVTIEIDTDDGDVSFSTSSIADYDTRKYAWASY
jgi:prepilin-type N-terminal cleavage/methylation domain-containing protein